MRRALAALAVVALAGCGGAGGEEEAAGDPGVFLAGLVRSLTAGNYGKAWDSLLPAHKLVAPRAAYVACERRDHVPARVTEIEVVRVVDEQVGVAGEEFRASGAAVTLHFSVGSPAGETSGVTDTFHAVAVEGGWAWILPPERYAAYRAGRCP